MRAGFDYPLNADLPAGAGDVGRAIRVSITNLLHHQLGWSLKECEKRAVKEERRLIPRGLITELRRRGWNLDKGRVLDVGAGQGGLLLELLTQGADAYGVEPGSEFGTLARMRLKHAGFHPGRVISADAENLPFPDDHFDHVICAQVLEHVRDPEPVLREIFRVLEPAGRCYISCENYLAFFEQEYRVVWLPLLPKAIAALYLRARGRDPTFLLRHVHYTTYPQIWRLCRRVGFINETYDGWSKVVAHSLGHLSHVFRVGVVVQLRKPTPPAE